MKLLVPFYVLLTTSTFASDDMSFWQRIQPPEDISVNGHMIDWLFNYIKNSEIQNVKFVLSTSYAGIISRDLLMTRLDEDLDIISEDKQLKASGMASMLERGKYINNFLTI